MQLYPGSYDYWQILWTQIVLFAYVQLTTAAALYTQNERYAIFVTKPLEKLLPWKGRELLVKVHAANGILLFFLNLLCTISWFYLKLSAGLSLADILLAMNETATIGWINVLSTSLLTLMGVFGISLYRNNNPNTLLPFWKFEYYLSRFIHRIVFASITVALGYHIFFIKKIYVSWTDWSVGLHPFAVLFFGAIISGSAALAIALLMILEIPTSETFAGKRRRIDLSLLISMILTAIFAVSCLLKPFSNQVLSFALIFSAVAPSIVALAERARANKLSGDADE